MVYFVPLMSADFGHGSGVTAEGGGISSPGGGCPTVAAAPETGGPEGAVGGAKTPAAQSFCVFCADAVWVLWEEEAQAKSVTTTGKANFGSNFGRLMEALGMASPLLPRAAPGKGTQGPCTSRPPGRSRQKKKRAARVSETRCLSPRAFVPGEAWARKKGGVERPPCSSDFCLALAS